jgi:hypothetical protein
MAMLPTAFGEVAAPSMTERIAALGRLATTTAAGVEDPAAMEKYDKMIEILNKILEAVTMTEEERVTQNKLIAQANEYGNSVYQKSMTEIRGAF